MRTHFNVATHYIDILVHLTFEIRTEAYNPSEDLGKHSCFLMQKAEGISRADGVRASGCFQVFKLSALSQ